MSRTQFTQSFRYVVAFNTQLYYQSDESNVIIILTVYLVVMVLVSETVQLRMLRVNDGMNMMAAALISIALQSFLFNISSSSYLPMTRSITLLTDLFVIINWIIAVVGVTKNNHIVLKLALVLWSFFICYWIVSVAFTIITQSGEKYMCSYNRCPESMWLFNNSWHKNPFSDFQEDYELDYNYVIKPVKKYQESADAIIYNTKENIANRYILPELSAILESKTHKLKDLQILHSSPAKTQAVQSPSSPLTTLKYDVLIIIIISTMFGIFAFGWLLLYSYEQKLKSLTKKNNSKYDNYK